MAIERLVDIHFEFIPTTGVKALYGLRIVRDGEQWVVILTELPDNPGMSVTNAAEKIATKVRQSFGLDPDQTRWIEHYPERQYSVREHPQTENATFDEIIFTWENYRASEPTWRRLVDEEVEILFEIGES